MARSGLPLLRIDLGALGAEAAFVVAVVVAEVDDVGKDGPPDKLR
jgi:hypothetical protein